MGWGREFIRVYYRYGPGVAEWVVREAGGEAGVRGVLKQVHRVLEDDEECRHVTEQQNADAGERPEQAAGGARAAAASARVEQGAAGGDGAARGGGAGVPGRAGGAAGAAGVGRDDGAPVPMETLRRAASCR